MSTSIALSVLVPTYARADLVAALLERLDAQTLPASSFELILVDDGSPEPVVVDTSKHDYSITLLRQENAGPAAARNLGLERCSAPLTLILNDDAVPADDLLEVHLKTHAGLDRDMAVLGTFQFTEAAREWPFVQLLAQTDLLFDFPGLKPGRPLPWTFFWTCNISLSTERLKAVGGFDAERFPNAIVEDVELGYRLEGEGLQVYYEPKAVAWHDHALTPTSYFKRSRMLGVSLAAMHDKHGDHRILWLTPEGLTPEVAARMQTIFEAFHSPSLKLLAKLEQDNVRGRVIPPQDIATLSTLLRKMTSPWVFAGMLESKEQRDAFKAIEGEPTQGELTSIVVVTRDAQDQTRRCLESLRRTADSRYPTEFIFVDNGSVDGTAEYLEQQADVQLIRNSTNLGAPHARNQAIGRTRGAKVVFMDSDVMVTKDWLRRMLYHAEVDLSGVVGCLCDRAAHGQQVDYSGPETVAGFDAVSEALGREQGRKFRFQPLLTSFLILVRREVLDAIGGFDERFSPWGFEDDDFSLRAQLAGFRNRVALDVFVRHEGYDGPKAQRHAGLLERNWVRFSEKWGAPGASYGDYKQLDAALSRDHVQDSLYVPFDAAEPASIEALAAPLPSGATPERETLA